MRSIKGLSTIVLIIMAPFVLFYSVKGLFWAYDNSFGDASWWVTGGWAAEGANITTAMKAAYFTAWSLPVFTGVAGFLVAIRILWGLRQGRVFEITVANGLRLIGIAVFLSSALHMGAACVSPMIQSWNNPDGAEPLRFWYSHAYIGLLFCGFGFWMMGQVMTLAITAVRENEEFV